MTEEDYVIFGLVGVGAIWFFMARSAAQNSANQIPGAQSTANQGTAQGSPGYGTGTGTG